MVEAMDGREFNNVTRIRCSYGTTVRCVAIQGLVCSPWMIVIQIRRHNPLEMPLVEYDHLVEKFSAWRPNHSFHLSVLPGPHGCRDDLVDTQTFNPPRNALTVYAIAVSNQITGSSIKPKRFDDLLRSPLRRGMFRHVEVNNSPSVVGQHDEDEQHPKRRSRDNENVYR